MRYTVARKITDVDEAAISALSEAAWEDTVGQDGRIQDVCHVAELTGPGTRVGGLPCSEVRE